MVKRKPLRHAYGVTEGFILCIVCAQLCGFQHLDAFGLERGAQSLGKAGARHLVLDAEGDDAMQAGAFQTDGSAVRRHPGWKSSMYRVSSGLDGAKGSPR